MGTPPRTPHVVDEFCEGLRNQRLALKIVGRMGVRRIQISRRLGRLGVISSSVGSTFGRLGVGYGMIAAAKAHTKSHFGPVNRCFRSGQPVDSVGRMGVSCRANGRNTARTIGRKLSGEWA